MFSRPAQDGDEHGIFARWYEADGQPVADEFPVNTYTTGTQRGASVTLDPLGNATHTALSFDLVGEDVLITGAGPIGIMAAAVADFRPSEVSAKKIKKAAGAPQTTNAAEPTDALPAPAGLVTQRHISRQRGL